MSTVAFISTPASPKKRDKVRKRADSIGEEEGESALPPSKKPRMGDEQIPASPGVPSTSASISTSSISTTRGDVSSQASSFTQVSSSVPSPRLRLDLDKLPPRYPVPLSRRSSMASISRPQSPLVRTPSTGFLDSDPWPSDVLRSRIVRRTASSASLRSMSPGPIATPVSEPVYAPESARNFMRNPKFVVDYSQPSIVRPQPPAAATEAAPATEGGAQGASGNEVQPGPAAADNTVARNVPAILPPPGFIPPPPPPVPERDPRQMLASVRPRILGCSGTGILFFTRANRLHFKNLSANEEVGQIYRVQESHGAFTAIACSGGSSVDAASGNHGVVAVGTSKGLVAIYNVQTKKRVASWLTKPVASLAWNNKILTVGCTSGSICHFDTRITPVEKMKEQALTVTRHQAPITCMEWNADGDVLASADKKGNVYCWKSGDKVPLDIGEFVMRRKKIKHTAAISAISWCPWQPKNLLTADVKGVIQFWTVDPKCKDSNALTPARLDTGSAITGVHWSTQCKEILTTHGYKVPKNLAAPPPPPPTGPLHPAPPPPAPDVENTLAVWQFPSLRFVTKMQMNTTDVPIGNSVTYSKGMKVVFAVPDQGKIHTCDVWGKRKPDMKIRRQSSLDYVGIIR